MSENNETETPVGSPGENIPIKKEFEKQAGLTDETPALPEGQKFTPKKIEITEDSDTLITGPEDIEELTAETKLASVEDADIKVSKPAKEEASKMEVFTDEDTPEAIAAKGQLSKKAIIGDIQGEVSEQAIAKAATGELDEKATVRYQLGELYKSLENAEELPAWASPAVRAVGAQMAARGLGSSSMAAAAITQAIYESGVPIAKADADKYQQIQLVNLSNEQQAVLQNAATFAAMDKANLDARMTAAVNNAKAFLSIDLQNLTNEQKTAEINYQGKLQKLLADSAAKNAARQFNAETENQVNQFFAQLDASIDAANANRLTAVQQFNASSTNAMNQFNKSLENERNKFNANMALQIEQSNTLWRRQTTTANTQADNEAERINAQNLLNITQQAQAQLWQEYRDNAAWAQQFAESETERNHQYGLLAAEISGNEDLYKTKATYNAIAALGEGLLYKFVFG
tara:strand:+ start:1817 stop:3196 length:1380 start_codon:yes stop_codon:yes gene_type:complete